MLKVPLRSDSIDVARRRRAGLRADRRRDRRDAHAARLAAPDRSSSSIPTPAICCRCGKWETARFGELATRILAAYPGAARRADRRAVRTSGGRGAVPLARLTTGHVGRRTDHTTGAADALHARADVLVTNDSGARTFRVADAACTRSCCSVRRRRACSARSPARPRAQSPRGGDPGAPVHDGDLEGAGVQSVRERVQSPPARPAATTSACSRSRSTKSLRR